MQKNQELVFSQKISSKSHPSLRFCDNPVHQVQLGLLSDPKLTFDEYDIQLNSCNSNSYNSKNDLNRRNSLVPSEFASKPYKKAPII